MNVKQSHCAACFETNATENINLALVIHYTFKQN